MTACRAPDEAAIVFLYSPHYDFAYKDQDDRLANNLASGMDDCPRRLFYQLIAMIRDGTYWKVDPPMDSDRGCWAINPHRTPCRPPVAPTPKDADVGCLHAIGPHLGGPPFRVCPK